MERGVKVSEKMDERVRVNPESQHDLHWLDVRGSWDGRIVVRRNLCRKEINRIRNFSVLIYENPLFNSGGRFDLPVIFADVDSETVYPDSGRGQRLDIKLSEVKMTIILRVALNLIDRAAQDETTVEARRIREKHFNQTKEEEGFNPNSPLYQTVDKPVSLPCHSLARAEICRFVLTPGLNTDLPLAPCTQEV
ncbi:hypothetical protein RRG08_063771 [Elysia crispata]|uniref:Uncharacterized protein n=1 Tax=Elysia crispata TaxID=231223 RepID=A0AAE1AK84_9GAST|nr:hypothetical protein RRG08_063771 [Elysia crispata]